MLVLLVYMIFPKQLSCHKKCGSKIITESRFILKSEYNFLNYPSLIILNSIACSSVPQTKITLFNIPNCYGGIFFTTINQYRNYRIENKLWFQ